MFARHALAAAAAVILAAPVAAQTTLTVAVSDEYGPYIAGPEGPVYAFLTELMAGDGQAAVDSCNDPCREDWPPVSVEGEIGVGEGLDPALAAQLTHEGATFAVYDSHALFYYHLDTPGGEPQGHGLSTYGGWWVLLAPDGTPINEALLPARDGDLN